MKRVRRRLLVALAVIIAPTLLAAAVLPLVTYGVTHSSPDVVVVDAAAQATGPELRVLTLNIAHGRSDGANQLFCSTETIVENLDAIAAFMRDQKTDVAAQQEADGPCAWSGNFSHVDRLARKGAFGSHVRAENVRGLGLTYGTALLSRPALSDPYAGTFDSNWPTFSKGFVVATVAWPGRPELLVDVVSVHLDFASESARGEQIDTLVEVLSKRDRPRIVMGDFNAGFDDDENTLQRLSDALELSTWKPDAPLTTFPSLGERLDWILVSRSLGIRTHTVHDEVLSDHRAVSAVLFIRSDT